MVTEGDQNLVAKVIQLQDMLRERQRRVMSLGGSSVSGGSGTDSETDEDWVEEANQRHAAFRERYRREVMEPRREARKAARAAKREAQLQRMVAAAEAVARRREAAEAARGIRAAKRARRVVVLRAVRQRKAARATPAAARLEEVEQGMAVAMFLLTVMSAAGYVAAVVLLSRRTAMVRAALQGRSWGRSRCRGGGRQRRRRRWLWWRCGRVLGSAVT